MRALRADRGSDREGELTGEEGVLFTQLMTMIPAEVQWTRNQKGGNALRVKLTRRFGRGALLGGCSHKTRRMVSALVELTT